MKDKVKGLIIGALLGSAITGTAAYASGTQIEVLFRPLTFLFDGVEKQPAEGASFIYDGSTYVPLRFISETLGKEVGWDDATGTVTIDEPGSRKVVAQYSEGSSVWKITQGMVNKHAAVARLLNPSFDSYAKDPGFLAQMQTDVASYLITEGRADESAKEAAANGAAAKLADLKKQFEDAFHGQPSWEGRLAELKLTEADVLNYERVNTLFTDYLNGLVTEKAIKSAYEGVLASHEMDTATVRHVLVGFTGADGKTRTKEEALARAKEAQDKLKNGESFDKIAPVYSDDPGSKDKGGLYEKQPVSGWVEGFKNAVLTQKAGVIGDPVETEYGYHVIKVEALQAPEFNSVLDTLKNKLLNDAYQNLVETELPKLQQKVE